MLNFDNRFVHELPGDTEGPNQPRQVFGACWSSVSPTPVAAPTMLAHSPEVAAALDLDDAAMASPEMLAALAGNALLPGMVAYATCYGGHQFGQWAGQLGDGRAILLGEAVNRRGQRFELQLKGAGPTPYARRADGRAVLRSSLREFLCSEAMHHLGVPTTRALSLVDTGETVVRDMFYDGHPVAEPGAVVCRVAPSFTRFGHFELLAARGERQLLQRLVDFTIARDFPDLAVAGMATLAGWFGEVCERTARLLAHWLRVGFVHGVMNTDNMSILGLTIDYGPYGWVDNFDPGWTPNTTDASSRRYCFARQPEIARWNLLRLAEALATLTASPNELAAGIERYDAVYSAEFCTAYAAKLGFLGWQHDDGELLDDLFDLLRRSEIDMTLFFRQLAQLDVDRPDPAVLRESFYREELRRRFAPDLDRWLDRYAARLRLDGQTAAQRILRMNDANPRFVLRNYLAQQAIDRAEQGDTAMLHDLLEVLRHPFDEQPGRETFSARRPDWARHKAGCSMLSCSS
ncbi:MAG: YdiU family protein [Rhodobacteraceae bacterium]|uniref:protein adenylyltransferase SelO n=1 Tax=Accumulibacter sp. TaxID=2053492 RepID=UPI001A08EFA4|nr:YdiU family protein [Accumulibacter sp.]MBE2258117.1 YdiU family protein [Paracoccaceae bacterium]MCB1943123.1 YdiU family protein [Accumulibacter sp.]